MAKRIIMRDIERYDESTGSSLIRELEMAVDAAIRDQGYSMQFWLDMRLYGLDESVQLLTPYGTSAGMVGVRKAAQRIKLALA